jgi:alpha-glucosidase
MRICRKVYSVQKEDGYCTVKTDGAELHIWFVTNEILRVRAGFDGTWAELSYSLMLTAWPDKLDGLFAGERRRVTPRDFVLRQTDAGWEMQGETLCVEIEKQPFRLCVRDAEGDCLHADIPDLGYQEDSNHRRIHTSEIGRGDRFYGFGEKTGPLNKYHKFLSMSPKDTMGYDPANADSLYKHIPFYIRLNAATRKATGYFYNNTAECDFDMGREHSNYWKPHSRYRTDSGDIDLFLIAGPAIADVVRRYTDLTGKSAMLPRFALGYLGSSMYYSELEKDSDNAILHFIDTCGEYGIPVDGFQLSSGYTARGGKRCVFTWNKERFHDPAAFFAAMKQRGVSVSPNVKPGLLTMHPMLPELKKRGIFVRDSQGQEPAVGTWWGGPGVFADFTDPKARAAWRELLTQNLLDSGADSIWNDNCEYDSLVDQDCRVCADGNGGTIGAYRAVMSTLMCRISQEAIRQKFPGRRPFVVCRSGNAGIQRYAQTWAGDNYTSWETLRFNIATILGMSLSGVSNQGCDICGFYGPSPEPELMVRWVQNGAFQPRFSIHSANTDNTVTEPWMYPDCTNLVRDAIRLRYRLNPFYYALMARAHETGLPILQPMVSAFQNDPACDENSIDFMVGDALLVANVVEKGQTLRKVYFPAGERFYDLRTRQAYEGGRTVGIPVTLASIPMFLRSGAILPISDKEIENLHREAATDLRLICAADQDGAFTLYEDDGITDAFESGVYRRTQVTMHAGARTVLRFAPEGSYASAVRRMHLDVISRGRAPYWVEVGGRKIAHFLNVREFEGADEGWYYDPALQSVQVRYDNPDAAYEVLISFEAFDLLGM